MKRLLCAGLLLLAACQGAGTATLSGRVVIDGQSDASGVTVKLVGPGTESTATDVDGHYAVPNLPLGVYAVSFLAADTVEESKVLSVMVTAQGALAPDVHFTPAGSIAGTVTLAGVATAGVSVFVDGTSAIAVTDSNGRYSIAHVPAGARTLAFVQTGFATAQSTVTVARGQLLQLPTVDLAVDDTTPYPVAALSGVALRVDQPDSAGTMVTATLGTNGTAGSEQYTTVTAADGSYTIDGIPSGIYAIRFDYDGRTETIPQVLALSGSTGQVVDGALYPLVSSPLTLPVARRLVTGVYPLQPLDHGHLLVYVPTLATSSYALAILDLQSGAVTTLANNYPPGDRVVVSPDKTHILFPAASGNSSSVVTLQIVALDGSAPVTLAPQATEYYYSFSSDGSRVLYETGTELHSVLAGGGGDVLLASGSTSFVEHPDGQRVVYQHCTGSTCTISVQAIAGGPPTDILSGTTTEGLLLSPDGKQVASFIDYQYETEMGQLEVGALDGSTWATLWSGVVLPDELAFSTDSQRVLFGTGMSDLRLATLGAAVSPPPLVAQLATAPVFSADGTRFIYRTPDTGVEYAYNLVQQPATGGTPLTIAQKFSYQLLTPDGKHTVVIDTLNSATSTGTLKTIDAAGSAEVIASDTLSVQLSSDGAHLLYSTANPTDLDTYQLWSAPVPGSSAGTTPVLLADAQQYPVVSSPGGGLLYYADKKSVLHLQAITGGADQPIGAGSAIWLDDTRIALTVGAQAAPFRFQNGIYVWDVTP